MPPKVLVSPALTPTPPQLAGESRTQSVPAYVILHDATLNAIARLRPETLDDLATVSGVGAKKLERYGAAILARVADEPVAE